MKVLLKRINRNEISSSKMELIKEALRSGVNEHTVIKIIKSNSDIEHLRGVLDFAKIYMNRERRTANE